ncbi:11562_t:CDS:2 [Dentiscutata heterogama]|uniref:11562_t:CDS:1 n=1 Tax=Dentiscutata heterogama TaxID=1316150 RepID=A0ACA9K1W0_9GLOM|nr:11562_t:CDS:2 [Dentiscutata heterogama]
MENSLQTLIDLKDYPIDEASLDLDEEIITTSIFFPRSEPECVI